MGTNKAKTYKQVNKVKNVDIESVITNTNQF